jgi:hypothetical protein
MTLRVEKFYNKLIINTLYNTKNANKWRRDFFIEVLWLILSIKGRINFLQFARYGKYSEQRYRQQFEKPFDFLNFNKTLVLHAGSGKFAIGFDPSYISKSGKHTPGLGYFWSGCASKALWGLEIGGIAAIDLGNKTAFHLEAIQTPNKKGLESTKTNQIEWYADLIVERSEELREISTYLVVDAYFSKKGFVNSITQASMHVISRFRDDADLKYLNYEAPTGKKGRPKKYKGKINPKKPDLEYFQAIDQPDNCILYCAIVYSKALKRNIKLVIEQTVNKKNETVQKLFFSTDMKMDGIEIMQYYRNRFQMEFLYRDGKQHTGLEDCQAREENKLNFHFNLSLTAINAAKIEHWLSKPENERGSFSMADVKTMQHNALLLERFFDVFAIKPNSIKNHQCVKELINFGKIAA